MTPSFNPGAAPLPPLPAMGPQGSSPQAGAPPDQMAALVSGIAPVKQGVDAILAAAKQIVQSGAVPGAEQVCGQIVALATSLLPMAAQQALQPGMGGGGQISPIGGGQ